MSTTGWRNTAASGRTGSIVLRSISVNCKRKKARARTETKNRAAAKSSRVTKPFAAAMQNGILLLHPSTNQTGDHHASSILPLLQRPLRGSDRVLQEDARRQGRNDNALQGCAGRPMLTRYREQDYALVVPDRRHGADGNRRN